jgi:hypothetical protein
MFGQVSASATTGYVRECSDWGAGMTAPMSIFTAELAYRPSTGAA